MHHGVTVALMFTIAQKTPRTAQIKSNSIVQPGKRMRRLALALPVQSRAHVDNAPVGALACMSVSKARQQDPL